MHSPTQHTRGRSLPRTSRPTRPTHPPTPARRALLLAVAALAALTTLLDGSPPAQAQSRDVPGPPRDVVLAAGDGKLTLTWRAPASWGSLPAKGYEIDVAAGRWYGSADPPENTHGDWEALADPDATATSYTFTGRLFRNSVNHSYRHTVTNGTRYHLRIRAVSAPAGDPSDEVPGFWIVKSAAPVAPGFTVTPSTLTVPVGSRACYLVSPTTPPAAAVTITANTAALSAEIGGSTVTYATTFDPDTGDWGTSGDEDRKIGRAFCVKGVTATPSPVTITHTATSDDTDYDGVTVPSVTLTVSAADSTPVVRFLHASMRIVEGDSNLASRYPVDASNLHRFIVRLDIAPAPSSAGHVVWYVPHPDCNGVSACPFPASTSAEYNIDYVAQWLLARRVSYSAGSNDMQFEFLLRADDVPEDDETVTIYLLDQSFEGGFAPNTAVCVGACDSPTTAQQSVVVTIIDDDAGDLVCPTCARGGDTGRIAIPRGAQAQALGRQPDAPRREAPPPPPAAPPPAGPTPDEPRGEDPPAPPAAPTPTPTPAATGRDTTVVDPPPALSGLAASYDTNGDGAIDGAEYQYVKHDWLGGKISYEEFLEVVRVHIRSG